MAITTRPLGGAELNTQRGHRRNDCRLGVRPTRFGGSATLAGTLIVHLVPGFTPTIGQSFDILTFASAQGTFSSVTGLQYDPSGPTRFDLQYNADRRQAGRRQQLLLLPAQRLRRVPLDREHGRLAVRRPRRRHHRDQLHRVSSVLFGSAPALSYTVVSPTQITAHAPPGAAGVVDRPGQHRQRQLPHRAVRPVHLRRRPRPRGQRRQPRFGRDPGWHPGHITGINFTGATAVAFGSRPPPPSPSCPTRNLRHRPGVRRHRGGGRPGHTYSGTSATTSADQFTYTTAPLPAVTGISPATGKQRRRHPGHHHGDRLHRCH